jgi:hypothetical protein
MGLAHNKSNRCCPACRCWPFSAASAWPLAAVAALWDSLVWKWMLMFVLARLYKGGLLDSFNNLKGDNFHIVLMLNLNRQSGYTILHLVLVLPMFLFWWTRRFHYYFFGKRAIAHASLSGSGSLQTPLMSTARSRLHPGGHTIHNHQLVVG